MNKAIPFILFAFVSFKSVASDFVIPPNELQIEMAEKHGIKLKVEASVRQYFITMKIKQRKLCKLASVDLVLVDENKKIAAGTRMASREGVYYIQIARNLVENSRVSFACIKSENKRLYWLYLKGLNNETYNK